MPDQSLSFWLTNWYFEPSIILGLVGIYVGYVLATGRYRSRFSGSSPVSSARFWYFTAAIIIFALALLSPLDKLGDEYWFTAHMFQHVLLTLIAPPLLIIGTPGWLFEPLRNQRTLYKIARLLTNPCIAFLSFNVIFTIWHVPNLYNAALADERVHIIEHLSFMVTAVLTWMPVLSPTPLLPRLAPPVAILYLFLSSIPPTLLGALITFAESPIYSFYASAPRIWGLGVMDDQIWAGLIMWTGGAFIWLFVLTVVFFKWFNRNESTESHEFI